MVSVVCFICVIGLYIQGMWSVMWVAGSNIVIGRYVLDMWSVLFFISGWYVLI